MEWLAIVIVGFGLIGTELYLHIRRQQQLKGLIADLAGQIGPSLATLEPDKRYILALPSSLTDSEFAEAVDQMRRTLGLEDTVTHVVIVHGEINMVEFS